MKEYIALLKLQDHGNFTKLSHEDIRNAVESMDLPSGLRMVDLIIVDKDEMRCVANSKGELIHG